jgi:flavin-dependent dehydrogenase
MVPKKESVREKNKGFMADVVVIGGGPGGAVAAKNCAQHGMRTILLERKKLPRHKVCGGIIVSNMASVFIDREAGVEI